MKNSESRIILGIDPGTNVLGYSVLKISGSAMKLIELDVLRMERAGDHYSKLKKIFEGVRKIIRQHQPEEMAIESPFFGKNIQSMLKLGRAQGVAITVALSENVSVVEYSPRKIKQSITGNGNADKLQVMKMLQRIVSFTDDPKHLDATDALAVAVCHHFQGNVLLGTNVKKINGWKDFLGKNPGRIKLM